MNADQNQFARVSSDLRSSALICGFILLCVAGCCTGPTAKPPYYGPTLAMNDVVTAVNTNNQLIPSLTADVDFTAVVDDNGTTHSGSGSGSLLYRRPGELRITGESLVGKVFEVGSNPENYWLALLLPQIDKVWYGSYAKIGLPGVQTLPIQPDMLVEVLGIATFNTNFLQQPAPVMTFNHDDDSYEFTWSARLADRWCAVKRITYDRATQQPTHVALYDENGRTVLRADLSKPTPIEVADLPQARWPMVAARYDLYFPDSKIRLGLKLSDTEIYRTVKKTKIPNDRSFRMPDPDAWPVSRKENVIEVDHNARP